MFISEARDDKGMCLCQIYGEGVGDTEDPFSVQMIEYSPDRAGWIRSGDMGSDRVVILNSSFCPLAISYGR